MPRLCLLLIICYFAVVIAKGGGRGGGGRGGGGRGSSRGSYGGSSHSYPSSNGLSGHSAGTGQRINSHAYPESTGLSGNKHKAPSYTSVQNNGVQHHYHYLPPKHISYGWQQYPVFVGRPPTYVYMYKDSGSRFNNILTGLALYNLGRSSLPHSHRGEYISRPGEMCKLGISKGNGEYEETRIDCKIMSSFIWEAERESDQASLNTNDNLTYMKDEGQPPMKEALQDKGAPIKVTSDMRCYMIRIAGDSILKKNVKCGLLQEYAARSLRFKYYHANQSTRIVPAVILLVVTCIITLIG